MLGGPRAGGFGGDEPEGKARQSSTRAPAVAGAGEEFEEFPGALEDGDDDLPF
jgi:hypothetical protein